MERALAVAAILAFLVLGSVRKSQGDWFRLLSAQVKRCARFLRLGAKMLIGTLTCWLGLVGWSSWSAGGATPPAKPDRGDDPGCHLEHPARHGARSALESVRIGRSGRVH